MNMDNDSENSKLKQGKEFKKYAKKFFASNDIVYCLDVLNEINFDTISEKQIKKVAQKLKIFLDNYPEFNILNNFNYLNSFGLLCEICYLTASGIQINSFHLCLIFLHCFFIIVIPLEKYRQYQKEYHNYLDLINPYIDALNEQVAKNISQNKEPIGEKENISKLVNDLAEEEIITMISELESKILLLPKEEEQEYLDLLYQALKNYQESLNNYHFKDVESSFDLDFKSYCIHELKEELKNIESKIKNKKLFISEEEYLIKYNNLIATYLSDISGSSNKVEMLLKLMLILPTFRACSIEELLKIKDDFAKCFWQTIKYCTKSEQKEIISKIKEEYLDRTILYGEYLLDSINQTIEVIKIRQELLTTKEELSKKEYLYFLVKVLKQQNILKSTNVNKRTRKLSS